VLLKLYIYGYLNWHSPIVTDTSLRRILDFQTVPG
jgi:hypothetical protein